MKPTTGISVFTLMLLGVFLACASCSPAKMLDVGRQPQTGKTSRFTGQNARPGMTKEEFLKLNGDPYKAGFRYDTNGDLLESLYYKEPVGSWYMINTVFHFRNGVLFAQEQLDEERIYKYSGNNASD